MAEAKTKAKPAAKTTTGKTNAKPVKPAPKAQTKTPAPKKVAKPTVAKHNLSQTWSGGASGVGNSRISRTKVDASRFGSLSDAPLTERDREAISALRQKFGGSPFARANIDAGILNRLGQRGFLKHVSGADTDATAQYQLTAKKAA